MSKVFLKSALHVAASRASVISSCLELFSDAHESRPKQIHSHVCQNMRITQTHHHVYSCVAGACAKTHLESQINTLIHSSEVLFSSQLRSFRQDDPVNSQRTLASHIKTNNALIQNYDVTLYSCTVSSAYLCCVAKWFLSAKREFCVQFWHFGFCYFTSKFSDCFKGTQSCFRIPKYRNPYPNWKGLCLAIAL